MVAKIVAVSLSNYWYIERERENSQLNKTKTTVFSWTYKNKKNYIRGILHNQKSQNSSANKHKHEQTESIKHKEHCFSFNLHIWLRFFYMFFIFPQFLQVILVNKFVSPTIINEIVHLFELLSLLIRSWPQSQRH